jgi:structural maintenance of chromosome 2
MWLTEVIIDGFKSYAAREVVSGFDMSFNAITGLNGTGKSNILDAICFVLGISNLTQVPCLPVHPLFVIIDVEFVLVSGSC